MATPERAISMQTNAKIFANDVAGTSYQCFPEIADIPGLPSRRDIDEVVRIPANGEIKSPVAIDARLP